jgi:hypothetical protein
MRNPILRDLRLVLFIFSFSVTNCSACLARRSPSVTSRCDTVSGAGWLHLYVSAGLFAISFGPLTLAAGVLAFLGWALHKGGWPFGLAGAGN